MTRFSVEIMAGVGQTVAGSEAQDISHSLPANWGIILMISNCSVESSLWCVNEEPAERRYLAT